MSLTHENKYPLNNFIRKILIDKNSYLLNGNSVDKNTRCNFEYKIEKSEAILKLEAHEKGLCLVPRWLAVVLSLLTLLLVIIFIAALVLVINSPRNAIYGESCKTKNCWTNFNLQCINSICQCSSTQFYTNKCEDLQTYGEGCYSTTSCDTTKSLSCSLGKCDCSSTQYWSSTCIDRLTYNTACSGDQCKTNLNLICSSSTGKCDCSDTTTLYWNGASCIAKQNYGESCTATSQCLDSELTYCSGSICTCTSTQYWKSSTSQCTTRVGEYVSCTSDSMCFSPMYCSAYYVCRCSLYYFYDTTTSTCIAQYTNSVACTASTQCRQDLQLSCINNVCACLDSTYTWSIADTSCKKTYAQTCSATSDCNTSENLICSTTTDCNCPTTSTIGMCDCQRVSGTEKYWDGTQCTDALAYLATGCTQNYQCKTITENTVCNAGVCVCYTPGGYTSNNVCLKCENLEIYNSDKCYLISTSLLTRDAAQAACQANSNSNLVSIKTSAINSFLISSLTTTGTYWTYGERVSSDYVWISSGNAVDDTICVGYDSGVNNMSPGVRCLYFDTAISCFYRTDCEDTKYYVCERS